MNVDLVHDTRGVFSLQIEGGFLSKIFFFRGHVSIKPRSVFPFIIEFAREYSHEIPILGKRIVCFITTGTGMVSVIVIAVKDEGSTITERIPGVFINNLAH